jgi:tetratricopeptide (TPR) repeat protein
VIPVLQALLLLFFAVEGRAVEARPPCAKECETLVRSGELRPGVSVVACTLRLCQEEARQLYADGRYEEALGALDHIREGRGGMPSYELERGLVLYALGRFEEAVAAFEKVLEGLPSSFRAASQRAHALARLDRLDEAHAQFEKLLELPGVDREFRRLRASSYLRGNMGVIELRQGKIEQGKASLQKALDEDGSNSLAGTMLYKVVPSLEAGALEPEAIGLLERSYEDLALGLHPDAIAGFTSVVDRWPRFEVGWWVLGEIQFARLDYAACEDVYTRAAESLPAVADFKVERLRCTLLRHGVTSEEGREAVAELRTLAELHPENRRLQELLFALDL